MNHPLYMNLRNSGHSFFKFQLIFMYLKDTEVREQDLQNGHTGQNWAGLKPGARRVRSGPTWVLGAQVFGS